MKNIIGLSFILFVFMVPELKAKTVKISGTYTDKKNNPIASANVDYYLSGNLIAASTLTGATGFFSLEITHTGVNPGETGTLDFQLSQNQPNPFSANTFFNAVIPGAGTLSIYSITGKEVARLSLSNAGTYELKWGGKDKAGNRVPCGVYLYSLSSCGKIISNKMTVLNTDDAGTALAVLSYSMGQNKTKDSEISLSNDILRFTKTQTSQLELSFETPVDDTILGNVVGNVGPIKTGTLVTSVNTHSLPQWNLNQYFYNDDQSIYQVNDPLNFTIVSDTMLVFTGTTPGHYSPQVTATDPVTNNLTANMVADITVSNEQDITITGTYRDKLGKPIAAAGVYYYQKGSTLLGQTTTTSLGTFSFTVTTTGTTLNTIRFLKPNTSLKNVGFHTPEADTSLGVVTGNLGPVNTGIINETHFTIENTAQWNLNSYFTNDDQNAYEVTGSGYSVSGTNLFFSVNNTGTFTGTVIATDPQDPTLTAIMNVTNTILPTMVIPDFTIPEDTAIVTLIPDLNVYKNPGYTGAIAYSIISNSNSNLLQVAADDSVLVMTYLQPNGNGTIQIGIKITNGSLSDTCYFNIVVQPRCDLNGYIYNISDDSAISGATLAFSFPSGTVTVTADNDGYYSLQMPGVTTTTYFQVLIQKSTYTPYHTWATLKTNNDTTKNYLLIPLTFKWDLYSWGFRASGNIANTGAMTLWWASPPYQDVFSDDSLVGGVSLTPNVNNLLINLNTILPVFDPLEAFPANIVQYSSFTGYTPTYGHLVIYWDNSINASGMIGLTLNDPIVLKGSIVFKGTVGGSTGGFAGPDNWVFNQELGSAFVVWEEPPAGNYVSVFTDPPGTTTTYTPDDFYCQKVRLSRAKCHFYKGVYQQPFPIDPNFADWEMRPDSVAVYFPNEKAAATQNGRLTFLMKQIFEDGSSKVETWDYDKVPSSVMRQFRFSFTKEEIEKREKEEQEGAKR